MEIDGVRITTIVKDNVAIRCDGCLDIIEGTPWRVNLLDIVATEKPPSWNERPAINPGPFQSHSDPACVRRCMAARDYFFCGRGQVRAIRRRVPTPTRSGDGPISARSGFSRHPAATGGSSVEISSDSSRAVGQALERGRCPPWVPRPTG